MRISFDLDQTLICYGTGTPSEPKPAWYWRLFVSREPLRFGTRSLLRSLREGGWDVWIYTTSYRDPSAVRRWLRSHDVHVFGVINQAVHERHLRSTTQDRLPSKNPKAFGIDLHVDDLEGVRMEGEQYGFQVVVVTPDDESWTEKVMLAAEAALRALPSVGR